jgi:hypothetical protein
MSENRMSETKLREQRELAARAVEATKTGRSSSHLVWKIVGGAALALAVTSLVTSLHDIRRYIRMTRM